MLFGGQDLEITLKLQIFVQVCLTLFFTGFTGPEAGVPVDKSSEFEGLGSVRMQGLAWAVLDQLEQEQDALERAVDELSEEGLDDWEDDMEEDDLARSVLSPDGSRRRVRRVTGGPMHSTMGGYVQYGDDRTYLQNFAMSRAQQCHIPRRLRSHAVGRGRLRQHVNMTRTSRRTRRPA